MESNPLKERATCTSTCMHERDNPSFFKSEFIYLMFPWQLNSHPYFRQVSNRGWPLVTSVHLREIFPFTVWEKPHLKQWVWEFLPNGGNIPKSKMLVGFFLPMGKIILQDFFSREIFHGTAYRSENPTKIHGVLCFKVRYLKNYNQYRCTFW
jgi:hypothetical protein